MRRRIGMNRTTLGLTGLVLADWYPRRSCLPVTSAAATTPTVVTIQFDDGNANQYTRAGSSAPTACTRRST
jgi:hypothetical protein